MPKRRAPAAAPAAAMALVAHAAASASMAPSAGSADSNAQPVDVAADAAQAPPGTSPLEVEEQPLLWAAPAQWIESIPTRRWTRCLRIPPCHLCGVTNVHVRPCQAAAPHYCCQPIESPWSTRNSACFGLSASEARLPATVSYTHISPLRLLTRPWYTPTPVTIGALSIAEPRVPYSRCLSRY